MSLKNTHQFILLISIIFTAFNVYGQDHWTYVGPSVTVYRCFAESEQYLYSGTNFGDGSVQRSSDQGGTWEDIRTGLPSGPYVNKLLHADTTLYAGLNESGGIYYLNNHSDTWKAASLPNPAGISALIKAGAPWNEFFACSELGVLHSLDGMHWSDLNSGLAGYPMQDIILSDSILYAASYYGVYTLQPGDTTWESFDIGLPGGEVVISLAANGNTLYAGTTYEGLFVSTDHGPWTSMNNGINIDNTRFNDFVFYQSTVFTATSGGEYKGVFISHDDAEHWSELIDGFPPTTQVMELHISEPYIFAATSKGIFRRFLSSVTGQNEITQATGDFTVYPNPSSGYLQFSDFPFSTDNVLIQCINQTGGVVYSGHLNDVIGKNGNQIDLSNLPDGMYSLCIIGENLSGVKRFMLVR